MARMQSMGISVTYAGEEILTEKQYLANDQIGLRRSFTTTAEPLVDASAPVVRAYGNAQGEYELSVQEDFGTKAEAMSALLERTNFAEAHQTGELCVTVGGVASRWQAGVQGVDCTLGVSPGGKMRLVVSYSFILGAKL